MKAARDWARRHARWSAVAMAVVLLVVTGALLAVTRDLVDGSSFHRASQFAGSQARFAEILTDSSAHTLSKNDVLASLAVDSVLAAVYGVGLWLFLWTWWCPPFWKVQRVLDLKSTVLVFPVVAAVFDWLENIVTAAGLDWTGEVHYSGDRWALAVATLSWIKWFAVAGAVLAAFAVFVAVLLPRAERVGEPPAPVPSVAADRPDPALGVCCSGGGIRAAGYTAGALRALEAAGVLDQADVIAAVSGGAYFAGSYASLGGASGGTNARDVARFLEGTDLGELPSSEEPPVSHHRYLQNDPGGLVLALARGAISVLFNVAVVATVTIVVAWPIGRFFASNDVDPYLRTLADETVDWDTVFRLPARLWLPAASVLALALLVMATSALVARGAANVARLGARVAAGGAVLALLVVVPWALAGANWLVDQAQRGTLATAAIAGVTIGGIAGAVWRVAAKPLAKAAPRLGGVLLAIVVLAFAGWVASNAATHEGWFDSVWVWRGCAAGLALTFCFVDIQWFSMRLMYRTKLRRSFALRRVAGSAPESQAGALEPVDDDLAEWKDVVHVRPELLVCATAQQIGLSGNGIPAQSFTISAREVSMGDTVVATEAYLAALPSGLTKERTIASWQATTGAAFSSAMGRFGYGSTNALLAALNIDLGAWLPNPTLVRAGYRRFPRVRLPYMVKEIFGVYDKYGDEYVFVADGGQWENLGLVELLRRRCRTIVCVDASGDPPGSFRTLLQAIDLAGTELAGQATIDVHLEDLRPLPEALAKTDVACWTIAYGDRPAAGLLLYAKAQTSSVAGLELQRYAKTDHTFPHYSTARQLLSDDQFRALVALGTEAGNRLAALAGTIRRLDP